MKPRYYIPPNDGANWKCVECGVSKPRTEVWLTEVDSLNEARPIDKRIYCKDCIEPDWLDRAEFKGELK